MMKSSCFLQDAWITGIRRELHQYPELMYEVRAFDPFHCMCVIVGYLAMWFGYFQVELSASVSVGGLHPFGIARPLSFSRYLRGLAMK
jgi:hypothetical protein